MALYKDDFVDIELSAGNIHRSYPNKAIGFGDNMADRFGVRLYRDGEPVSTESANCQAIFMAPDGTRILIQGNTYVNYAWVNLPQACYNVNGRFTLAIKVIGEGITGTMRILDGVVSNTGVEGAVAPTQTVPTYQEVLAVYDQMVAAKEGSVRFDITQNLTTAQKAKALENVGIEGVATVAETESYLGIA